MAEGGDAEDEIQFLRTVRLRAFSDPCVYETIIRARRIALHRVRGARRAAASLSCGGVQAEIRLIISSVIRFGV